MWYVLVLFLCSGSVSVLQALVLFLCYRFCFCVTGSSSVFVIQALVLFLCYRL